MGKKNKSKKPSEVPPVTNGNLASTASMQVDESKTASVDDPNNLVNPSPTSDLEDAAFTTVPFVEPIGESTLPTVLGTNGNSDIGDASDAYAEVITVPSPVAQSPPVVALQDTPTVEKNFHIDPSSSLSVMQADESHTTESKTSSYDVDHIDPTEWREKNLHLEQALQLSEHEHRTAQVTLEDMTRKNERLIEERALAEAQYRGLFKKVTQMKTTLGDRLKQDAEEITQNRSLIDDLEVQNAALNDTVLRLQEEIAQTSITSNASIKDHILAKEDLQSLNAQLKEANKSLRSQLAVSSEAYERTVISSAEWENLAIEERSARDALRDRIADLQEQLASQNSAYENLRAIVDQDNLAISKFKHNIYELQEAHKLELRETVDSFQTTIAELTTTARSSEERTNHLRMEVQNLNHDIKKLRSHEQDAKEKNLLIGKLRHEAVILNEHLTKALRLLKRGSSNDTVDRQLLNNLLLSFLALPRQDSKRFEVLKLLANVLAWTEGQKETAGLVRPGSGMSLGQLSPSSTRSPPMSPSMNRGSLSRRTSGSLQLQAADFMGSNRESMSDLWINFLQTEAAAQIADNAEDITKALPV